jgi:hypothetical protein
MDSIIEDIQEGYTEAITYLEFLNGKMTELTYYGGSTTDVSKLDEIKKLETKINIYSKFAAFLGQLLSKYKTGDKKMEKFEKVTNIKDFIEVASDGDLFYGGTESAYCTDNMSVSLKSLSDVIEDIEKGRYTERVTVEPLTREQLIDCLLDGVDIKCVYEVNKSCASSSLTADGSLNGIVGSMKYYDYYKTSDIEGFTNDG